MVLHPTCADQTKPLVVRMHDESGDSDIFGADASTCRPFLLHGIMECIAAALAVRDAGSELVHSLRQTQWPQLADRSDEADGSQ